MQSGQLFGGDIDGTANGGSLFNNNNAFALNMNQPEPAVTEDVTQNGGTEQEYHFDEGIVAPGQWGRWQQQNRTLKFEMNPTSGEGIAWVGKHDKNREPGKLHQADKKMYPCAIPRQVMSRSYANLVEQAYYVQTQMQEAKQQYQDSRAWEMVARDYIEQFIDLLTNFKDADDELHEELLLDTRNIVMCFASTKFVPSDQHYITEPFLRWVNTVDGGWSTEDTKDVMRTVPPTDHPSFWQLMKHNVVRGLDDVCIATLKAVLGGALPTDAQECIEYTIQLFKSYPEEEHSKYTFRQWRESCLEARGKATEIADPELRMEICTMLDVMSGSTDSILNASDTWYEAVGALLKYHDPTRSRLSEYYAKVVQTLPVDPTLEWEQGCAAVVSGDFLTAILKLESLDLGVAATMGQFALERGLLDQYVAVSAQLDKQSVPNWLSITHAQNFLGNQDMKLTKIGIEMLQGVGTLEAIDCIAEVLPRIEWKRAEDIDWATGLADALGLEHTTAAIRKSAAHNFYLHGYYYDAFVGLAEAGDVEGLASKCWKLFEKMLVSQDRPKETITVAALTENSEYNQYPVVKECMAPCAVLNGFLQSTETQDPYRAGKYIAALFKFSFLPVKYYALLAAMVLPLLSRDRPRVFPTPDLMNLMAVMNKWDKQTDTDRHEGLALLEHSMATAPANVPEFDWRSKFQAGTDGMQVLQQVRIALSKEASRCFLLDL